MCMLITLSVCSSISKKFFKLLQCKPGIHALAFKRNQSGTRWSGFKMVCANQSCMIADIMALFRSFLVLVKVATCKNQMENKQSVPQRVNHNRSYSYLSFLSAGAAFRWRFEKLKQSIQFERKLYQMQISHNYCIRFV